MSHTDLWPLTKPIFYYYWQIRNGAFVAVFRHDWYWRRLWTRHGTLGWTTRLLLLLWSGCQWLNIFFGTRVRRPFSDIRTFRSSWITYLYFAFFGHFRFFVFDPNRNFIPSIDSYYDNITNKNHLHYRLCPTSHNNKNAFFCDFYCIFCISRIFQRRLYRFFFWTSASVPWLRYWFGHRTLSRVTLMFGNVLRTNYRQKLRTIIFYRRVAIARIQRHPPRAFVTRRDDGAWRHVRRIIVIVIVVFIFSTTETVLWIARPRSVISQPLHA